MKLGEVGDIISVKKLQLKSTEYQDSGRYPIIDQGQEFIAGYTDRKNIFDGYPVIIFGDHTRITKWVNQKFVPGADGTQIIKAKPLFDSFLLYLKIKSLRILNLGYSRHFKFVKEATFKIPENPKEQKDISSLFQKLENSIGSLMQKKKLLDLQKKGLMQQLLTGKVRVKR